MNLVSPWTLLGFAPLAAGIVILWMLRRKRQDVSVPSLLLWRAVLQETTADTPFRRLRRSLLLFLQLLVAFLLLFALARPFVWGQGRPGRALVVVLDTGASMAGRDVRPTRLDAARDAARAYLRREMGHGDVAAIVTAGPTPVVRLSFTSDVARLDHAIGDAPQTDAPADLPAALGLALSLAGRRDGARIEVFSDGALGADDDKRLAALPPSSAAVHQEVIGTAQAINVGITALDARRDPATGRRQVFVGLSGVGSNLPAGATLSLLLNGSLLDARAVALSGGAQSETFDDPRLDTGGIITARLDDVNDDLAADNQSSLVLSPLRPARVLLVSPGSLFLERGLSAAPDVSVDECAPAQFTSVGKRGQGYALVVWDGPLPPGPLPAGNYLTFGAVTPGSALLSLGSAVPTPAFVDQDTTYPVMRFVDMSGVHIARSPKVRAAPWAQTLAEGTSGPWMAAGDNGGHRQVSVAFALADSDWPLRVSFPIFLSNAVDWLAQGGVPGALTPQTPAGRPAVLTVPPGLASLTVTRPDGSTGAIAAPPDGGLVTYAQTARVGLYHARGTGGIDYPFAVNLLDPIQTSLPAQEIAALNRPGIITHTATRREHRDLWTVAAAIALGLLLLEWLAYHRRIG